MHEFLLLTRDIDGPGRPKKGDVLCVRPQGFAWGARECLAHGFLVVALAGVEGDLGFLLEEAPGLPEMEAEDLFRAYFIAYWEHLSVLDLAQIQNSPWLVPTIPASAVRAR